MKALIRNPINDTQAEFNRLCELGGGPKGGPARGKVVELLKKRGQTLNEGAYEEMAKHLQAHPSANPWHVCFAIGLCWGHLARPELAFTSAVVNLLDDWNDDDLKVAKLFHLERGPEPIEQSLVGAHTLFEKVVLPDKLPTTLRGISQAQERWLSPLLIAKSRPKYIGSWNATAMFMAALFAQPFLAKAQIEVGPVLPPGGPIFLALKLLHHAGLGEAPAGSTLDDDHVELGALYENNKRFAELRKGLTDCSILDIHSGLYMLGTRHPASKNWE